MHGSWQTGDVSPRLMGLDLERGGDRWVKYFWELDSGWRFGVCSRICVRYTFLEQNTSKSAKRTDGGERVEIQLNIDMSKLTVLDDLVRLLRKTGENAIKHSNGKLSRSSGPVRVRFSDGRQAVYFQNIGAMIDANTPKTK